MLKSAIVLAVTATFTHAQTLLIDNANVFDGERAIGVRDVLIEDGLISRIAPTIDPPEGAEVIDATDCTLMPGLIDAHTHTFELERLRSAASLGVTTVLDMFTPVVFIEMVNNLASGDDAANYADMKSATTLLTAPGGHGTQYGVAIDTVSSPDDVEAFIDARIEDGADYIKIVCEDGAGFGREVPCIDEPTLREAVRIAHENDLLAVVHVTTLAWAQRAVDADADVLVHICSDQVADDRFVQAATRSGIAVTPTLAVIESVAGFRSGLELTEDDRLADYLVEAELASLATSMRPGDPHPQVLDNATQTVRMLHQAGVPILAGTDPPNPGTAHGASLHRELQLLERAGLTNAEALAAATSVTADVYNLTDRGRIEPGKRADLLLVEGDPTSTLDDTRNIRGVWRAGRRVERRVVDHRDVPAGEAAGANGAIFASSFDNAVKDVTSGAGWIVTLDSMRGGTSTGTVEVVEGGVDGSAGALRIAGTIVDTIETPWAGAQLSPGRFPFQPADLSTAQGISFAAKGDGRGYAVLIFTQSGGFQPILRIFTPGEDWTRHAFTWREIGTDAKDVTAVMITCSTPAGDFELLVDDFKIE